MISTDTLEKFVLHDSQSFEDYYELHEVLGSGKFGTVYKCKNKEDGKLWAAKIIKTVRSKDKDAVKRELEIMSRLKHNTLLRCLEAYQTHRKTIMIMECITGGELFERITGDDMNLTEGDCINFMRQICTGVNHMHQNNILHLDLKPENIMCLNETGYDIKIIDFGLAQKFKEGDELKVMFGTPEFVAPEIVRYEDIGFGTDMWAVGVICYTLLSGLSPFMGDDDNETLNNVTKGFWDFEDEAFDDISNDAKKFVEQLLVFKKEGRMTASQCLEHSWLTTRDNRLSVVENKVSTDRLKKFVARRRWQKTTHAVRAIGRMSILRLATQQRKQNVSPTPDNSSEKKNATDKLAGDKDQATDKAKGKEKGHLKDSLTQTSKSEGGKTEKVNSETSPIQPNDYLTHLTEHNRRITGEGYAPVDQKEQKVAIDERSQSSVSEERINKGSSHSLGTATLNTAGYGFNTGNSPHISRKELRDRKVKSGVKALVGTSSNFEEENFPVSIEESSVNRHLCNETGALQQVDGPSTTGAVRCEYSDRYSISDGMRKEEAKKESQKGGSIDSKGTKDNALQVTEQQPPALKSILKRRPKSPTEDCCVVPSDVDEESSESRSRQINSYVNKPTTVKDGFDDLLKGGDVSSNQETLGGSNIPRSRQDLWGAHSDLLENERGEGKERIVQNVSLGKQKDLTSTASGGELKVDKDVISLSEQTSRSFELNSETPVSPTTKTTTTASASSSETEVRLRAAEGISATRSTNTVGTELPLSVDDGSYVNVGDKSTKSCKDFEEERVGSTSSYSSDIHESPMQSLPQKQSQPNAMESYLSHKRGTRSSSPYSRRTGRRPDDDNNNVPTKQDVAQAPVFLQKFHHIEFGLPVTYEVKFECKIDGYPKPEILWYKDGKRVLEGHDRYKFQSGPNGWFSLIIPRAMESDKGSFMCEARNSAGKARCSGKLILVQADSGDTDGSLSPKTSEATGHRSGKTVSSGFLKSVSASLSGGRKSRRTSYDSARLSQSSTDTEEKPKGSGKNTTKGPLGDDNSYLQRLRRLSSTDDSDVKSGTLPRRSASVNPQNRRRSPSVERARRKFERKDSLSSVDTGTVRKDFFTMIRPRNSITSLTAKFENSPQDSKTTNGVAAKSKPQLSRHDSIGKSSLESKRSLFKSNDKENGWRKETTKSQPPAPVKLAMLTQSPGTSSLVSKFQSQPSTQSTVQSKSRSSPFLKSNNKAAILAKFESSGKGVPQLGANSVTVTLTPKLSSSQRKPVLTTDIDTVEFSPPSFVERPTDQSGFKQDSVRFVTVVDGSPKPRVSWHFRGNGLKDGGRFKICEEKGKHFLNINELEHNDEGLYTCRVQNASGRVSASVQLEVTEKPKTVQKGRPPVFLQKISDVEIHGARQTARFDCKIVGVPKPEVTWLIEGKSLSESSRHKFEQHDDGRCALIISDVISDDDAIYTCLAKNEQGQACSSAELIFGNNEATTTSSNSKSSTEYSSRLSLTTPSTSKSSSTENHAKITKVPEFVARPQSLTAANMNPAHFSCIVRGKPEPEITWEKDGVLLKSNDHYNIHTEEGMSLLKIMNTSNEDVGKYICKAKNEVGSVEAEFDVLVEVTTESTEGAPHHGSADSIEDTVEDPLFITEDESSHAVPTSAAILSDVPPCKAAEEDNSPEFEITVSVRPQTESAPSYMETTVEPADVNDIVNKPKTLPQFVELPKSVTTDSKSTAKFLCMVQGDPKPTVSWKKDGQIIPTTDDRFELSEGDEEISLKIRNVTVSDQGMYTCTLTNTEGEVTASADLFVEEVNVPPKFVEKPCDRRVQDGEKVVFTCKVEGQPMPAVEWLYQNQPLPSDGEVYVVNQDGDVSTLTLPDVIVDDEGEYVAKATNAAGEIQVSANLTVTAPPPKEEKKEPKVTMKAPTFIQPLQENMDAIDGAPMSLAVRVAGKPKPKMSWFFNGEQIKEDEDFKFVEDGDRYSLVIAEVFPDDGGKYVCRITNEAGTAECSANVEVKEPVQEGSPPTFAQKPRSVSTDEGCSVSLNCHVAGDLPILVTWHKDGQLINHGKRFKLETSGPEGLTRTLHIPAVLATDAGSYQCTIENKFGVDKCTASLVVKQLDEEQTDFRSLLKTRPRLQNLQNSPNNASVEVEQFDFRHVLTRHVIARKHPQVVKYLKDQQVDEGTRAVLECNIDGHPEPKISWFHEDKEIKESKFFHMTYAETVARLEISEAFSEDEGDYMCRASNSAGETKCTAKLRVKRADSDNCLSERRQSRVAQPYLNGRHNSASSSASEDTPTRKMSSTLNITLSPPVKVKPVTPVTIEIDTNSLANGIAPSIPSDHQQTTASSRVISRGDSTDISTDFDDYDPPKQAGKSPEFLSELDDVHFVEGTSARLRCKVSGEPKPDLVWLKDGTEIKEGKKYKVDIFDEEVILTVRDTTSRDAGSYTLEARNSEGMAKSSAELLVTAPPTILQTPGPVRVAVGTTATIECKFSGAPAPTVTWRKLRRRLQTGDRYVITSSDKDTTLAINDVDERDGGRYTLVLENGLGSDEAIVSLSVIGQPDPPTGKPLVTNVDSSSVVLSWSGTSYDGGSRIIGYIVESRESMSSTWKKIDRVDSTSLKVTGLQPDTEYHFRVRAENDFEISDAGRMSDVVRTNKNPVKENGFRSRSRKIISDSENGPRKRVSIKTNDDFNKHYDLKEQIGKGRFGTVYLCVEKATGKKMAAKFITTTPKEKQEVKDEIGVMGELSHPKLIRCYDAFEDPKQMVMVLEFISGGELFERVIDDDFVLTESDVIKYIRQVCEGVKHMHDKNILHLDLKPENIMCVDTDGSDVKLIDFGLARKYTGKEGIKVMSGTPEFVAPEVINFDEIGYTTDMWSVGVIAYILLSGLSPFMGDDDSETLSNVTLGEWDFEDEAFDDISDDAKDFISKLLVKKKERRLTAEQALQHKWLNPSRYSRAPNTKISTDKLKKFVARRRWQKTTNAVRAVNRMTSLAATLLKSAGSNEVDEPDASVSKPEEMTARNGSISLTSVDKNSRDTDTESMTSSLSTTSAYSSGAVSANREQDQQIEDVRRNRKDSRQSGASETDENENRRETSKSLVKPKFMKTIVDCIVFEGDCARFDCAIEGVPEPEVTWYLDDEEIEESDRFILDYDEGGHYSLIIRSAEENDEGDYVVIAKNKAGQVSCAAELLVEVAGDGF